MSLLLVPLTAPSMFVATVDVFRFSYIQSDTEIRERVSRLIFVFRFSCFTALGPQCRWFLHPLSLRQHRSTGAAEGESGGLSRITHVRNAHARKRSSFCGRRRLGAVDSPIHVCSCTQSILPLRKHRSIPARQTANCTFSPRYKVVQLHASHHTWCFSAPNMSIRCPPVTLVYRLYFLATCSQG